MTTVGEPKTQRRWLPAALRACSLSLSTVALIVIVQALRHGWENVSQPGDWIEKGVIFLVLAAFFTVTGVRRSKARAEAGAGMKPTGA